MGGIENGTERRRRALWEDVMEAPRPLSGNLLDDLHRRAGAGPPPMTDERRQALEQLGRAFDLLKTAHFSLRACVRGDNSAFARLNICQWCHAVEQYTAVLERLAGPPPTPEPPSTAAAVVERVKKQVIGRIRGGRFVRLEDE